MSGKVLLVLAALFVATQATSILWTGYVGDNQWTTQNNWYPNSVPGPNDDVTIEKGFVILTIPTGVNSLTIGTNIDQPANLTIYHAFAVGAGGMNIKSNGNLVQDSGLETVTGNINIDGTWTFNSGYASGVWTISSRGQAFFPGGGQRNLIAGAVVNQGTLTASGTIGLNMSAVLQNSGNMYGTDTLQIMVFDSSTANFNSARGAISFNGKLLSFQAPSIIGTITINAGDVSCYSMTTFSKNITIPKGSTLSTLGNANVTFMSGISGDGAITASGATTNIGPINIASMTIAGGNTFLTKGVQAGSLTLNGGTSDFAGNAIAQSITLGGGIIKGQGSITAIGNAYISTTGANLATAFAIAGQGTVTGVSLVTLTSSGSLTVKAGGSFSISTDFNITGPSGNGGFQNNGNTSVAATFITQNVDLSGSGSYTITGTISTSTCRFITSRIAMGATGHITGSNTELSLGTIATTTGSGTIDIIAGDYALSCPGHCDRVRSPLSPAPYNIGSSM